MTLQPTKLQIIALSSVGNRRAGTDGPSMGSGASTVDMVGVVEARTVELAVVVKQVTIASLKVLWEWVRAC